MALRHVLIELRQTPPLREAVSSSPFAALLATFEAATPDIPGIALDQTFPLIAIPARAPTETEPEAFASFAFEGRDLEEQTYLASGVMEESAVADIYEAVEAHPDVVAIYSDPLIEPCFTCINSPAVGTDRDVASLLSVPQLAARGMDGNGVLLAIVDTGINLAHLRSRGLNPNFDAARSFVIPPPPGNPPIRAGELPVAHGTMCAFDALIAAPRATLLDIAILPSRPMPGTTLATLLRDAILGYSSLLTFFRGPRRPGDFQSLVVSNSWGMFRKDSDFPVGNPGNYSDNPDHPFNRIVGTLERAGADILFAAGNCGHECPDGRCGNEVDAGIYGANSHPQVISVAGVDIQKNRVGYSTRGPGHLERQKPDISGFTHFRGSGVFPVDGGTSAATPVVAGVVAAFRSRFPSGPSATPSMVRNILARVAEDRGAIGFDFEFGWGVVNGSRLATLQSLTADAESEPFRSKGHAIEPSPQYLPASHSSSHYQSQQGDTMVQEEQFMRALAAFEEPSADVATSGVDVCGIYSKAKPILQGILPFIRLIPVIGKPAAKAIEALMAGLDSYCATPTSAPFATFQSGGTPDEQEFMQALSAFGQPGADVTASIDICGTYKKVKPILQGILPFIKLIPVIGPGASAAITALMFALDQICSGT